MKSDLHVYNVKTYNVTGFELSCNFAHIKRIYGMFLCKYGILTKTGTYLSLKLNLVFFVNF